MKQPTVLIVALEGGETETAALRSSLEYFGAFVSVKWIGRPKHFMEVLSGELPFIPDYVIISGHGDKDGFKMTELGDNLYEPNEPRGSFTPNNVKKYLKLKNVVLSTCCATGCKAMSDAFHSCTYIAPSDYVEGNSALIFALIFFYEILQNGASVEKAFDLARGVDNETGLFVMSLPQK